MIVVTSAGDVVDVPDVPGEPTPQVRASYTVTLTGVDGVEWNLNAGPVTLMAGTKLFDMPPITAWTKTSPGIAGTRWDGFHVDEQTYTLPVRVKGDDWESYRLNDKAFFASLDPNGGEVTVTVTAPDGVSRSIGCRFLSPGDLTDDTDPLILKRRSYQLTLLAPDPFWYGDVVSQPVSLATPIPWLSTWPPTINPPSVAGGATIANPGDVPGYWRAALVDQWSAFTIGVGDALVTSSKGYVSGRSVNIDSSPRMRSITDETGARVYRDMDTVAFAPIPPGAEVPIVLDVEGFGPATTLEVELTPLYWRPL